MEIFNLSTGAEKLGVSRPTFKERIESGQIPAIKKKLANQMKIYVPEPFFDMAGKSPKLKGRTFCFANLKGGVGKTSLAANFAYTMAVLGQKVLLVDVDPQAHSSKYLGVLSRDSIKQFFEKLIKKESIEKSDLLAAIKTAEFENATVDVLPSELGLGRITESLRSLTDNPHKALRKILSPLREEYDCIIIDTPPSPGLALQIALFASDEVEIVTDAEEFSVDGLHDLIAEIEYTKDEFDNEELSIGAIFINKVKRTNIHKLYTDTIMDIADKYAIQNIYTVPENTRIKEAQTLKLPFLEYKEELDRDLRSSEALIEFAVEALVRGSHG